MQFDVDIKGKYKDIFVTLKDIILSFDDIYMKKNENQTAFYDQYSAVCFLRPNKTKKDCYCLSLAKGYKLQEIFPSLIGDALITRHINFKKIDDIDKSLIKQLIKETMILNMESFELKKLRKNI